MSRAMQWTVPVSSGGRLCEVPRQGYNYGIGKRRRFMARAGYFGGPVGSGVDGAVVDSPRFQDASPVYDKNALCQLLSEKAVRYGDFTLTSGKKAHYFLDGKQVTLDPRGAVMIGEGILDLLGDDLPTAVGGMAVGADPITSAVVTMAGIRNLPLVGVLIRKEAKQTGTQQFVEGPVQPGDTVAIVEDVVTTGGSSVKAIRQCEAFGLKVTRVITIVDRLQGGRENFEGLGYRFDSLLTMEDLNIRPAPDPGS
jgi:orotate phosphoribosyltransferase